MWLGVLGSLLVRDGDTVVDVPKGRLRVLLAALAVRAGTVVSADALAEVVWDGSPPGGAVTTLRSYVRRLRVVLGPAAGARVVTRYPGYLLQAGEEEVDLLRFSSLNQEGGAAVRAGQWARAWELLTEGLGLWRGEPLADVPSDLLRDEQVPGLEESRLQAAEWRIDAGLQLGRHGELVAELQSLVAAQPLRERFYGQLMLALVRCGRQAEALAAYQVARQVLVEELGTEPGPGLRELHQQILTADPALTVPADPAPPTTSNGLEATIPGELPARVRDLPGRASELARAHTGLPLTKLTGALSQALSVPRQLPASVPGFTGRDAELAALTRILEEASVVGSPGTVVISAIAGTAGVGKTTLALHWAHQVAGRFTDGQLYVNMRGFDLSSVPMAAAEAMRGFLDALGVPPDRIPVLPEARAGLYRSLLADRKMLIVLDNARDEQQVRPLLPASPASLVIITSRNRLGGLAAADRARLVSLDVLGQDEAVQMLADRLGAGRAAAEPGAVGEIAALCGRLPLALAVAAARAEARPSFSLAAIAAELRDRGGRLDALDAGDPAASVRVVFSWSYRQLSAAAARMFRLLGLHPGPDISAPAAASLTARDEPGARRLLAELTRAHLVAEHVPGRYTLHDLLRAYASDQARDTDSEPERAAAAGRMLDHYLHTARDGAAKMLPSFEPIPLAPPSPGTAPEQFTGQQQALAWFEAEYHVLLAAMALAVDSGLVDHAWMISLVMNPILAAQGHNTEWAAIKRMHMGAAVRDDAALIASGVRDNAGTLGDYQWVPEYYASMAELHQRLGNRRGQALCLYGLAALAEYQGQYAEALSHAERSASLLRSIGDKAGEADLLNAVGWYQALLGSYEKARQLCHQALALNAEHGSRHLEGNIWNSLGYTEYHAGDLGEAAACYERAVSIFRTVSDRWGEADSLTNLGNIRRAADEPLYAREAWQQALNILNDLQHPDAANVRAKLAHIDP